jgi:hypothetical protein
LFGAKRPPLVKLINISSRSDLAYADWSPLDPPTLLITISELSKDQLEISYSAGWWVRKSYNLNRKYSFLLEDPKRIYYGIDFGFRKEEI